MVIIFLGSLCAVAAMTGRRSQFMAKPDGQNITQTARILRFERMMKLYSESETAQQVPELDDAVPASFSAVADEPLKAPSDKENPKCDQACTDGNLEDRKACALACVKLQNQICTDGFTCTSGCKNDVKLMKKDPDCENLCDEVFAKICYPMAYEASEEDVSPHHDDKPPPSVEATPAPRIFEGKTIFCNVYPSSFKFEVLKMNSPADKGGEPITALSYKQCDEITLKSGEVIGLRAGGSMAGISKPIFKIPTIMLFGQWAHGNHQVNFNRYFAKSDGPFVCNGFPIWDQDDINKGAEVQLYRQGYNGTKLAKLRYKECVPSSVHAGSRLAAGVNGENAGEYSVLGEPRVIVLGKAGKTTALAYEAWSAKEFGHFK